MISRHVTHRHESNPPLTSKSITAKHLLEMFTWVGKSAFRCQILIFAILVVMGSQLRIHQYLICFRDLFELHQSQYRPFSRYQWQRFVYLSLLFLTYFFLGFLWLVLIWMIDLYSNDRWVEYRYKQAYIHTMASFLKWNRWVTLVHWVKETRYLPKGLFDLVAFCIDRHTK